MQFIKFNLKCSLFKQMRKYLTQSFIERVTGKLQNKSML